MKILVDTHTHTVLSGHALSTLLENAHWAAKNGLEGIVNTEHGPAIRESCPDYCLNVLRTLPEEIGGVRIYRGIEANILDWRGTLDIPRKYLKLTDFVIASLHDVVVPPSSSEDHLAAYAAAFENPFVDVIGHAGNPVFEADGEALVRAAAKAGRLLEINNHSFDFRKGSEANCLNIIRLCRRYDVRVAVSSDAHFAMCVGRVERALEALSQCGFPGELVVNRTRASMDAYLAERRRRTAG